LGSRFPGHKAASPNNWFDVGILAFGAVFVVVLTVTVAHTVPISFAWTPNAFAWLPAVSSVANLALVAVLARRRNEGQAMLWFALYILFNGLWAIFETLERLTNSPAGDAFWSQIIFTVLAFLPTFYYLFIRSYTDRTRLSGSWRIPAVLLTGTMYIASMLGGSGMFPVPDISERLRWGYEAPQTMTSYLLITWAVVLVGAAVARLAGRYRHSHSATERYQIWFMSTGIVLLVAVESLTAVILPGLGAGGLVPSMGVAVNTIVAIMIIYSVQKYGSLSFNVSDIADSVLATMAEAVFVTDDQHRVVFANVAADKLLASDHRGIVGRPLAELVGGRLVAPPHVWSQEVQRHHPTDIAELTLPSTTGKRVVNVYISQSVRSDGGHVFVLSDVTLLSQANAKLQQSHNELAKSLEKAKALESQLREEKASVERRVLEATAGVQQEHARLLASINSLHMGYVMTDARGTIILANTAAQSLVSLGLGFKGGRLEVDPRALSGLLERHFGLVAKVSRCLKSASPQTYRGLRYQDKIMNVGLQPVIAPTGETLGAVVLLDDVTDLANLERARDEFFSIASHELRTPLTAIRGNTTMIQEYYGQKIKDKDVTSMLSDIHDSSVRLIAIVNDFLDMSRLEQGRIRFKFEKINAVDICRKAASEIQSTPAIPVVPIKISQPKPALPLVMADPDRLLQVVTNLIGNSLKFTERGSITIRFSQTDQNVIITVTDTGRGIAPEAKHLLFRKFQQASDDILTRDSTRSTGLGLYISRNLMRSMSGDLELVDSKLDEGSTFAVTVPIAKK
jgi:signal transduction histidine kinase